MREGVLKRYYVPTTMERFDPPVKIFGDRYSYANVVKDRKTGKNVFVSIRRDDARKYRDRMNAQEAAYPGGFNKRLK